MAANTAPEPARSPAASVVMYATAWCPYCARARKLLAEKGFRLQEIDIEATSQARAEMIARSGRHTVPQIFINQTHVGGCDDLIALDAAGGLDPLMEGVAQNDHQ